MRPRVNPSALARAEAFPKMFIASTLFMPDMYSTINIPDASSLNSESFMLPGMNTLQERLSWALRHSGLKKIDLARECSVTRAAVSFWFNGSTQSIEGANLTNLARATGVNPFWLATGKGPRLNSDKGDIYQSNKEAEEVLKQDDSSDYCQKPINIDNDNYEINAIGSQKSSYKVPKISWVQAGSWSEAVDHHPPGGADDYLITDIKASDHAFALDIRGNSMTPEFKDGDKIIVDPLVQPNPGDFVVAKNDKGEVTFKKYRPRGYTPEGQLIFELVPLNDDYASLRSDITLISIVGTVIEHRKRLRH